MASLVALVLTCDYGTGVTRAPLAEELGAAANKERTYDNCHDQAQVGRRVESRGRQRRASQVGKRPKCGTAMMLEH